MIFRQSLAMQIKTNLWAKTRVASQKTFRILLKRPTNATSNLLNLVELQTCPTCARYVSRLPSPTDSWRLLRAFFSCSGKRARTKNGKNAAVHTRIFLALCLFRLQIFSLVCCCSCLCFVYSRQGCLENFMRLSVFDSREEKKKLKEVQCTQLTSQWKLIRVEPILSQTSRTSIGRWSRISMSCNGDTLRLWPP